jgi:peroxiredoxin Q/BCP
MPRPKEGDKAPDFHLPASNGQSIGLKNIKGKNVVLYFYPKDDTPGCTVQACGFRDAYIDIEKLGAVVLGISPNNLKSHDKFIEKFNLPFTLLADEEKKMAQDYGVWIEKSMYGKKYMGVARSTFIIDKAGKIAKIFEKVTPKDHEKEVLEALRAL